jgi:hypothetical protein
MYVCVAVEMKCLCSEAFESHRKVETEAAAASDFGFRACRSSGRIPRELPRVFY